jgi:CDP-paratose 2-epimerase
LANLAWLRRQFGERSFELITGDVRDPAQVSAAAGSADVIIHLASQVAVTTSVQEPREDFETNALGTFNVLEGARSSVRNPIVVYASTNKVYGGLHSVRVEEARSRYFCPDLPMGIPEEHPLDFHSPYGCSKGAGDQYMLDYHRIYGTRTVVLRQSCIYGPRQFGVEDQGWVAWFLIALARDTPITIFGDGKQVRDILYIEDMLDAYDAAVSGIDQAAGQAFNIGGGPSNTLSIWEEFRPILEELSGRPVDAQRGPWRPGDQKVFIADTRKAERMLGWKPKVGVQEGIEALHGWVMENLDLFDR